MRPELASGSSRASLYCISVRLALKDGRSDCEGKQKTKIQHCVQGGERQQGWKLVLKQEMKFSFLTRPDSGERISPFVGKCFGKHQSV